MRSKMSGFTLIEVVVVMTIVSVLTVVVGKVLLHSFSAFTIANNISEAQWQANSAITHIVDDIHTIRSPSDITTATSNALSFTNTAGTAVSYTFSSNTLNRSSIPVASNISGVTYAYYNESNVVTAVPAAIRFISISVTAISSNQSITLSTLAAVRTSA